MQNNLTKRLTSCLTWCLMKSMPTTHKGMKMNNQISCFSDCDDNRFPGWRQDKAVEDATDNLMAECITLAGADAINMKHDLFDGMLLPRLMCCIANWQGSTASSATQMRELHNILADALQAVAEKEVA